MRRRPALDGLRAVAVLAVMAFHTSPAAHGGFLGVDVFFVISGYLITTLLLVEYDRHGRLDLRSFYIRRALRLGPALAVMLVLVVPLMLTVLHPSLGMSAWLAVASAVLYVANWANVVVDNGTGPITHTWSLSIEEQFYLLWPALLLAVLARRGARFLLPGLGVAIVVEIVARWISWDATHGDWIYYASTSHSDGLLIGAALAVLMAHRAWAADSPDEVGRVPAWSQPAAVAGVVVLAGLMATMHIDGTATFTWGLPLAALATAVVVHHVALAQDGILIRVLSWRPAVAVGTVSYGLYLFHYPWFQVVQHLQPGRFSHPVQHVIEIGGTVVLTVASYVLVEKPALRLKDRFSRRAVATEMVKPSITTPGNATA